MHAEKEAIAVFDELARQERPLLLKEGLQVIELPGSEREKFLKTGYEEGWRDILEKNPHTGPKLKELLTKK